MRLLLLTPLLLIFFTGCSQKLSNNISNYNIGKVKDFDTKNVSVTNLNGDGTIFKVKLIIDGKVSKYNEAPLVYPVLQKAVAHAKEKGYRYFQIIGPNSLSNANGFPLNTVTDLGTYLLPHTSNLMGGFNGLANSIDTHPSINIPFSIFGESSFEIDVILVKNPKYDDIVWDTSIY